MEYNSDYEVRLATLGALGGDTTKKYDSVYSIDLEILKLTEQGGGGGGMTYDQMKQLLASSGLTEIVFNDGASSITLDYDLVAQIGQGGAGESNYYIRNTYDELSGITGAKNGAIAYVKDGTALEEVKEYTLDAKGGWYDWYLVYGEGVEEHQFIIDDRDGNYMIHTENNDIKWIDSDGNIVGDWFNFNNDASRLPVHCTMSNGAVVRLNSVQSGASWETIGDYLINFTVFPVDNTLPSGIRMNGGTFVSSGVTESSETVTTPAKGWFQYYDAVSGTNKWIEKQVYIDNLTNAELGRMFNNYNTYHQNLSVIKNQYDIWAGKGYNVIFDCLGSYYDFNSMSFGTKPVRTPSGEIMFFEFSLNYNGDAGKWSFSNPETRYLATNDSLNGIRNEMNQKIGTTWENIKNGFQQGSLFSFVPSGSATFEVWSFSIAKQSSAQDWNWLGQFQRRNGSGRAMWTNFYNYFRWWNENSTGVYFEPEAQGDWQMIGYDWNREAESYGVCAIKVVDDGQLLTLYMATSKEGTAVGEDNVFEFSPNSEFVMDWTKEADEVIAYQPHLYQMYAFKRDGDEACLKRRILI